MPVKKSPLKGVPQDFKSDKEKEKSRIIHEFIDFIRNNYNEKTQVHVGKSGDVFGHKLKDFLIALNIKYNLAIRNNVINYHRNSVSRFFNTTYTLTSQDIQKIFRDEAYNFLIKTLDRNRANHSLDEKRTILEYAKKLEIFNKHRHSYFWNGLRNTTTCNKLDKEIKSLKSEIKKQAKTTRGR